VTAEAFPKPTHGRFDRRQSTRELHPYRDLDTGCAPQAEFLAGPGGDADITSDARNHAFVSGLGSGKTAAGVLRAAVNAERWNPGELGMIVAPNTPSIKNSILPVMREFGLLDAWEYRGKGAEQPGIITSSGARIILESADNDRKIRRLRGPNLAWAWIDEAAQISERAWEVVTGRLRVGNYRNAFVTTTPRGRNWVHDRFYAPDEPRRVRYDGAYEWLDVAGSNGVFGVPSWLNPHNPEDYTERLEAEYQGAFFEQEVEGAFTRFEGLIYLWFDKDEHVLDHEDVPAPNDLDRVIYGVDWGFGNPSVLLAVGVQGDRRVVLEEFYERRCTVEDMIAEAETMEDHWGAGRWYCDPAEPSNIEQFNRHGFGAQKARNDVTPGIQQVTATRDDLRVSEGCQATLNEFDLYQYKDADRQDKPEKVNDHAMDALRYALFTEDGPDQENVSSGEHDMSDLPV